jgi:predicted dehydrogenase
MEKCYRVALVGCGGMGRDHLKTLKGLADFEVVGLCDVSAEMLAPAQAISGGRGYADCEVMYETEKPDIVLVATQTRGHYAPSVAALERGIAVLCEKPIAIDLAEADAMVAAAQRSGAKLAINQQNHVNAGIGKAREMVRDGAIGDLVLVRGRNKCGRKSGNEFMEMGTHVTDMMFCFGGAPAWCSGTIYWQGGLAGVDGIMEAKEMSPKDRDSGPVLGERAVGQYGFSQGVLGEVHFLGYQTLMNDNYGVDILGTEGQLTVRASRKIDPCLWHLPRPMEGTPENLADWRAVNLGETATEDPLAQMYYGLVHAIERDEEPPSSGREGRTAFEMVLGLYQSHRMDGRRVELPLVERRHPLEVWRQEQ